MLNREKYNPFGGLNLKTIYYEFILFLLIFFRKFFILFLFTVLWPMRKSANLQVILWIPVRIVNDDCVCSSQVDAQATGAGAQQKHEAVGFWNKIFY